MTFINVESISQVKNGKYYNTDVCDFEKYLGY